MSQHQSQTIASIAQTDSELELDTQRRACLIALIQAASPETILLWHTALTSLQLIETLPLLPLG